MKPHILITKAHQDQISSLKAIADANRDQIGFIPRAKFQEAIDTNRIFIALINTTLVGFVIFRHRKTDQQTTLSEICILSEWRGHGIGKCLIQALQSDCIANSHNFIQLKCPVDLSANIFYEKLGFSLVDTEPGKHRRINVWRLPMNQGE